MPKLKPPTCLDDLSRDELLWVIEHHMFLVPIEDMISARWNVASRAGKTLMDESIKLNDALPKPASMPHREDCVTAFREAVSAITGGSR